MHSFVSCLLHVVFSTKERRPFITPELQEDLWPYFGGIEDHVHILLSLPATLEIAKAVQFLKGNSSKWIHDTFPDQQAFEWQAGYGAFSIGISGLADTLAYIGNQAAHHKKMTFQQELETILKKHGIEYEAWMLD